MARRRSFDKRRLRRERAQALERSYQRLLRVINQAALVMAGTLTVTIALELFSTDVAETAAVGPLARPILRHYASVIASMMTAYFGAVVTFQYLAPAVAVAPLRLVLLGAVFAFAAKFSFFPAIQFSGPFGAALWLVFLAMGITYAGALLFSESPR